MRVSSAVYLIDRAVSAAFDLQLQANINAKNSTPKIQRGKDMRNLANIHQEPFPSAAYHVTISTAAMQKMAASG